MYLTLAPGCLQTTLHWHCRQITFRNWRIDLIMKLIKCMIGFLQIAQRLSVHYTDKIQFMLIHGSNIKTGSALSMNFELYMGNHKIERTDNYRYLGIIMDDKLNWKLHISKLCTKLSNVCGILSKVRHYLDRKSLMLIYNSLFDSRLNSWMGDSL